MVSKKGKSKGEQCGMSLPEGVTSSTPSKLWKIIRVIYDDGPGDYRALISRMKARWRYYPSPQSLYTTLGKRTDVFIVVEDRGHKSNVYDLKEEIKNVMD